MARVMSWRDLFGSGRGGRVRGRYPAAYYDDVAKAIAAQIPAPEAMLLDFGCGEAPAAALIAEHCARLYLYDPAPKI